MGCAAAAERSMMESRRCARPTRRSGEIHKPPPSGPRWTIVSRMRARYSAVTSKLLLLNASTPEIPHICRYQVGLLEQIRVTTPVRYPWPRAVGNEQDGQQPLENHEHCRRQAEHDEDRTATRRRAPA